jgi:hypothetical protein
MTVIDQYITGRRTTSERAIGVQDVRTIGDYLPAIVGIGCAALAGIVTSVIMMMPGTY